MSSSATCGVNVDIRVPTGSCAPSCPHHRPLNGQRRKGVHSGAYPPQRSLQASDGHWQKARGFTAQKKFHDTSLSSWKALHAGGLTAAALLAKQGKIVLVLEQHDQAVAAHPSDPPPKIRSPC